MIRDSLYDVKFWTEASIVLFTLSICVNYIRFQTNTLGKGMNSLITFSYGLNSITALLPTRIFRH